MARIRRSCSTAAGLLLMSCLSTVSARPAGLRCAALRRRGGALLETAHAAISAPPPAGYVLQDRGLLAGLTDLRARPGADAARTRLSPALHSGCRVDGPGGKYVLLPLLRVHRRLELR